MRTDTGDAVSLLKHTHGTVPLTTTRGHNTDRSSRQGRITIALDDMHAIM